MKTNLIFTYLLSFALGALSAGCRATVRTNIVKSTTAIESSATNPRWQRVTVKPKPNQNITLCQKLNPVWWFGNIDDQEPPEKYRADENCRLFHWRMRNLGHNFTFYVIGIADKESERVGYYPERVFNPSGGWNVAFSRCEFFGLPFISYQKGGLKFYIGWRDRGNFGFKLNF